MDNTESRNFYNGQNNNVNDINRIERELKALRTHSIISIVLVFTLIGIFVSMIICLVDSIKILANNWYFKQIEDQKILWGILSLLLLGSLGVLIFACTSLSEIKKHIPNQSNYFNNSQYNNTNN